MVVGMSIQTAGDMMIDISGKSYPFVSTAQFNKIKRNGSDREMEARKLLKGLNFKVDVLFKTNSFSPESSYFYIVEALIKDGRIRIDEVIIEMYDKREPKLVKSVVTRNVRASIAYLERLDLIEMRRTDRKKYYYMLEGNL